MSEENNNQANQVPEFSNEEMVSSTSLTQSHPDAAHHNRVGVLLALLIVLLVVILGGLYVWFTVAYNTPAPVIAPATERLVPDMPNEPEMENADATVQQLETVSTSNEISAIEADIESTNLDELDAELNAIEAELDAAL